MKTRLKKTIHEYAASTSAHGIAYIFEQQRWKGERVFWILIVALALAVR